MRRPGKSFVFPLLSGFLLLLGLLVLQLQLFLGVQFVISSAVLLLGAVLLAPLTFIYTRQPLRAYLRATTAALALAVVLPFVLAGWQADVSRRRAATLIQSLEQYRTRQGHYPDSLAQLVPTYLPAEPHTAYALGQYTFYYHSDAADTSRAGGYQLGYDEGLMVQSFYHGPGGRWHSDD
ncbi:hypothetical protein [Hymenobacter jeollabukensis]|uniref:Type II secretion system protein GspG C-terminal domain-containing protein n=1 Tax=Hymenobacter jeollabukensis TaxID=2025313 RepID=A0A5R8WX27_9BACT|nr:hypothetical protein [Hymenobacter jeollabukensis]TLM96613.1 hypothetical protein FDY95_01055 [Hymenobacter jeollabukensis]